MSTALLIGNITIDHNTIGRKKQFGPGGSVYYMADTLNNFKVKTIIISPYGEDFSQSWLKNKTIYPLRPNLANTLIFRNIYLKNKQREQWVENYQNLDFSKMEHYLNKINKTPDIIIIAPIINNINSNFVLEVINKFPDSLKVLSAQGYYRKINRAGKVYPGKWQEDNLFTSYFDIIIVSEEDYHNISKLAKNWSRKKMLAVVTRETKGCSIYQNAKETKLPAFSSIGEFTDSTGSGDVFTASFAYYYLKTKNLLKTAYFASASSYLSLRLKANQLKYTQKDILKYLKNRKIII